MMHGHRSINVFTQRGEGGGVALDNFEKLASNFPPTCTWHNFVPIYKSTGHAFIFRPNCFKIF